jgi:putative ABC transport system substrate-binding protein
MAFEMFEARDADRFEPAFADMAHRRIHAVLAVMDSMFWLHRQRLARLEAKYRLAAMYGLREHVEAGSLMAYGGDLADLFRRVAGYIEAILKGIKPADLPIEQPTKFELVINLKTAKALGLTILPSVLLRADEVIQ